MSGQLGVGLAVLASLTIRVIEQLQAPCLIMTFDYLIVSPCVLKGGKGKARGWAW